MLVKVAIDLSLDRLFTYSVPEELQKKLAIGQLLSVPFGPRQARGFALQILPPDTEPPAQPFHIRPVSGIEDETPFFTPQLLDLVKRTAAYTGAPLESVLRAAVPAAVLRKNARPCEQLYVEAAPPAAVPLPPTLTPRQSWLLAQLKRLDGGWMRGLCEELKTTPATLRNLATLGYVTIKPRERRRNPLGHQKHLLPSSPLPLNAEQKTALNLITEATPEPLLLFGVTGSGKTEVYLQAIARELAADRSAIVMVPEIALTPQTVQRFASRFGDRIAVLHSALSDGERYDEWHRIREGHARVVVGPRSAVWAPVQKLGLIVVDEEHENSYKQEELPRYHARDIAVLRGAIEGAKVVLGSATPSLESWMNVQRGKYAIATLRHRAGAGTLPCVSLVEMTDGSIFSRDLLDAIRLRLARHEQTILFLNRRGYSRSMTCERCGEVVTCPKCNVPYTYHQHDACLRCHICGGWLPLPKECPKCHAHRFSYQGIGTQRAEIALIRCFREARILRMDADSTSRRHSHDDILGAFRRHEADILIGTQMIAKGLDFPNVTLVGVLNADSSLYQPDFRAGERTYQLLAQVSGRAGRAELPGEVFIQTHDPDLPVMKEAQSGNYEAFAKRELQERQEAKLPPFCHLSVIRLRSKNIKEVANWATLYAESLKKVADLTVSEAMPSALEKADDWYRWQVVIQSATAKQTVSAWKWITKERPVPKTIIATLDVDAHNLV